MINNFSIIFRLDAGTQIGLGHYYRCKALADALVNFADEISCDFAISQQTQKFLAEEWFLPHRCIVLECEDEFITVANSYSHIIIDNYQYHSKLFRQLSALKNSHLIIIDDECNRGELYADLIVNPADNIDQVQYQMVAPKAALCLGHKYALLRPEFSSTIGASQYEQRNQLLITFGGADVSGLTFPLIELLNQCTKLSSYEIVVITGSACKQLEQIDNTCKQFGFTHYHNVSNMAQIMSQASIAISAAGSTVYELACMGVPSIFAVVADNQQSFLNTNMEKCWFDIIDCRVGVCSKELIDALMRLIDSNQLAELSVNASAWVDGKGSSRVAKMILNL